MKYLREISPALATKYIRALPKSVRAIENKGKEAVASGDVNHDWVHTFRKLGNRAVGGKRAVRRAMNESPAAINDKEFENIKQKTLEKGRSVTVDGKREEGKKPSFKVKARVKPGSEKKPEWKPPEGYVLHTNPHNGTKTWGPPSAKKHTGSVVHAADVLRRRQAAADAAVTASRSEKKTTTSTRTHVGATASAIAKSAKTTPTEKPAEKKSVWKRLMHTDPPKVPRKHGHFAMGVIKGLLRGR